MILQENAVRKKRVIGDDILIATYNKKAQKVSDEHLSEIFSEVGKRYGYQNVVARFEAYAKSRVTWRNGYMWLRITVSDYLDHAPDDVLYGLAEMIFRRKECNDARYDECLLKYVSSSEYYDRTHETFIKRNKGLNNNVGTYHDLNDNVIRLREQSLIPSNIDFDICWSTLNPMEGAGCSTIHNLIWINRDLDRRDVPEFVIDYCIYAMVCHLIIGFHDGLEEYEELASHHPMSMDAEMWLDKNGLYI